MMFIMTVIGQYKGQSAGGHSKLVVLASYVDIGTGCSYSYTCTVHSYMELNIRLCGYSYIYVLLKALLPVCMKYTA